MGRVWPPCLCLLLVVACSVAVEDHGLLGLDDAPRSLLSETLREDILRLPLTPSKRSSRGTREVPGDVPWYSRATRGDADTTARDELQVSSVIKDDKFNFGSGVEKWHSLVVGTTTYLVGLGSSDLKLMTVTFITPEIGKGRTYSSLSEYKVDIKGAPTAVTLFKHWNAALKVMEAILVLAVDSDGGSLYWYRIKSSGSLEIIRFWSIQKKVSYLSAFKVEEQTKLLMITDCASEKCETSTDLYDFTLGASLDYKLSQSLSLEGEAVAAEVGVVGSEVYLVLPIPNLGVAKLYRYHWPEIIGTEETSNHSNCGSFEFWRDFTSPGVSHAVFFHVSYKMYIAIGGARPALFRFVSPTRLEGCDYALQSLGFVSFWLVLPVQNYRDEILLLAQVDHIVDSTRTREIVALTWAGVGVFNRHIQPKCFIGGLKSEVQGLSCIIADDRNLGLNGAVALLMGEDSVVTVLVPKRTQPSSLYRINVQLQSILNPLLSEVLTLKNAQAMLQDELLRQEGEMEQTKQMLSETLKYDGPNVINANWVIQEVETFELEPIINVEYPGLRFEDHTIDLEELKTLLQNLKGLTQDVLTALSDAAVPLNGELKLLSHQTLLGGIEVSGNSIFDSLSLSQLNGESVPALLKDAVRSDRMDKIGGLKTLSNLEVVDIDFAMINRVPKDDLIFNSPNKTIMIHGNIEITKPLEVFGNVHLPPGGTVGGLDLSEEIVLPGKRFGGSIHFNEVTVEGDLTVDVINSITIHPSNLRRIVTGIYDGDEVNATDYDTLEVTGQLRAERINGFLWDDVVKNIVWRDSPDHIEGHTIINGLVQSSQPIDMWQLNGLEFPDDYVLKTTNSQHVTGNKTIRDGLLANYIDIANTIDGVPVNALVTLTTDQNLQGGLKLMDADFLTDIKVDYAVNDVKLHQMFYQSPLIHEGGVVSSNVMFSDLEVEGPIQISGLLNTRNLKEDLMNIVVLPPFTNSTVHIRGKKTLRAGLTVGGPGLVVQSGLINGKKLSDFARVDVAQTFTGEKTIQQAIFGNLQLTGHWDGVNVVDLNAEAVRTSGIQETSSHLKFLEGSDLSASQLIVSDKVNQFKVDLVLAPVPKNLCDESLIPGRECVLKGSVSAKSVRVNGSVSVDGKVCNWNLVDFERRRMSRSRPQTIVGDYSFVNCEVLGHVNVSTLNGIQVQSNHGSSTSSVININELLDGGFAIDELYIDGNIRTEKGVNFLDVSLIAQNAVKLTASNKFLGSLIFEDMLNVRGLDVQGPVNRFNLAYIIEDSVLKNELDSVTLSGKKTFDFGFVVDGNIVTSNLNGLDPKKIVTKTSPNVIQGPLRVLGNVWAGNINVTGLLNGIPMEVFQNRYKLLAEGRHLIPGNAVFLPGVSVEDLFAMKKVNGVPLDSFFNSVVLKHEPSRISGFKYFINRVTFRDVAVAGLVNNISLNELASDVVLYNDENPVTVNGRITFASSLTATAATGGVSLSGNLDATELDGCFIQEWIDNAIDLAKPTNILGVKKFASLSSSSNINVTTLNACDLSKVITLHSTQEIPVTLNILSAAIEHNLYVGGLVNGRILPLEFENTLLTSGNQVVAGSKAFLNGFTVKNKMVTTGYISGRNISNVVTLHGNEVIKGPLKFNDMMIDGDLLVSGLISDLDVQNWKERAFLKKSDQHQVVTGSWTTAGQIKFMETVIGQGLLDGENVQDLKEAVLYAHRLTSAMQKDIKVDWTQLCHDTDALLEKARAQPFLFQQMEVVQAIQSPLPIASMHAFEALNEQFLAVSYTNSCSGAMYRWNGRHTAWELLDGAVQNIGSVQRWATLRNSDATFLVTSADGDFNCPYNGGNVWRFESPLKLRNVQTMNSWHQSEIDERTGNLHLLGHSGVNVWRLEDTAVSPVQSWPMSLSDQARFVPRSAGYDGLSVSDGESVKVLLGPEDNTSVSRSADSYLPTWNKDNVVTMTVAGGRKLVAVTAEDSELLVVYEDVATSHALARIQVHGAHSLSVLELTAPGRSGQTLLAFIENERQLRVVQYKGVEGFVDVSKANLAVSVKEMIPVRLYARGLVNQRHFLLLRSDNQVVLLEVEMAGDPADEPPLNCNLQ